MQKNNPSQRGALALQEALIGLIGWLTLAREWGTLVRTSGDGATLALAPPAIAQGFQAGWLDAAEAPAPVLVYPAELWWFSQVWRAAAVAHHGVLLLGAGAAPLALHLACDLPQALAALAGRIERAAPSALLLAPYSRRYLDGLAAAPPAERRSVANLDDIDVAHATRIPLAHPLELNPWLERLRLSPHSPSPA